MPPIDPHDLQVAHDLGTVEGRLDLLLERTQNLPELVKKVEKHDIQLSFIAWVGGTAVASFFLFLVAWAKSRFLQGR